jgi:hypothetical protein
MTGGYVKLVASLRSRELDDNAVAPMVSLKQLAALGIEHGKDRRCAVASLLTTA